MAIIVGTNSWTTIAEADTYLTDRINAAAWFDLAETGDPGDASKTSILVSAYYFIVNSGLVDIPASETSQIVKNAQAEAALFLLSYSQEFDRRAAMAAFNISEFENSEWTERFFDRHGPRLPAFLLDMLADYQTNNSFVPVTYDGESCTDG